MSNRFLIGIAAAFFAVFAIGIGAIVGITRYSDRTTISDVSSSTVSAPISTAATFTPPPAEPLARMPADTSFSASKAVVVAGKSTEIPITLDDINRLAVAVKLGSQNTGDVGRDVWARETPIAEKLLNGMCDCDQRNWLNHFVKAGKEALSGSENYPQSVQLLASLRRSNSDLTTNQARH